MNREELTKMIIVWLEAKRIDGGKVHAEALADQILDAAALPDARVVELIEELLTAAERGVEVAALLEMYWNARIVRSISQRLVTEP